MMTREISSTMFLVAALVTASELAVAAENIRTDKIILLGNVAGSQTVQSDPSGVVRAEYSFTDRGRGDHIIATWKVDEAGVPIEYKASGNDYMKSPVEETFTLKDGRASWKNRSEQGELKVTAPALYLPANPPPEFSGVLARALLKAPNRTLPLLPAGEASIDAAGTVKVGDTELTQYRISGIGFQPQSIWLDANEGTAGVISEWLSTLAERYEPSVAKLLEAQQKSDRAWSEWIANGTTRRPNGDLIVRNVRLFDPRDLTVTAGMAVLVRGQRIIRVSPDAEIKSAGDAETIDGHGRFLMPGMWDNHQHFSDIEGVLDLANGITSARDMANNTDTFLKRVERFDAGTELGPTVLKAGIIDGTGEFAGPTKMRVDNPEQAIKAVDWYADHGYVQIKIYSSVKTDLVPVIADHAHARGLRVSGHVPAFMSARQFIENGADEIQHLNFVVLNFLFPEVKETRNRDRFIKVAERARDFTPDKPVVKEFITFLKKRHTVLDPTVNVFEGLFCGDPAKLTPGLEEIAPRFPPQIRRALLSGALDVPKGKEDAYRAAFPSMLKLLKALHDAGVIIIPGTDALAGYTLHHELELYVRAGIPAPEVLRMATLVPAQVMGVTNDRGVIAPGKMADMVLVDGDPAKDIRDIRKIATVVKNGRICDPAAIEKALGILPRSSNR
jgi:hypothetical protein